VVDLKNPPERFWHCRVQGAGDKDYAVVNDLTFAELQRNVVGPWLAGRPFTISGKIIRAGKEVKQIQIVHTSEPQQASADRAQRRDEVAPHLGLGYQSKVTPVSERRGRDVLAVI
jgi:hypothetical protein